MIRLAHDGQASAYPLDVTGDLRAIACRGREHAVAVGEDGLLVVTFDGGATWSRQELGAASELRAVALAGADIGYAVGDGVVLRTEDGSRTWEALDVAPADWTAVTTTAAGTTAWLTAGPQVWRLRDDLLEPVHTAAGRLAGIAVTPDGDQAVAVGEAGLMIRSRDGGDTWAPELVDTARDLHAVRIAGDASLVVAVGAAGTVVRLGEDDAAVRELLDPRALAARAAPLADPRPRGRRRRRGVRDPRPRRHLGAARHRLRGRPARAGRPPRRAAPVTALGRRDLLRLLAAAGLACRHHDAEPQGDSDRSERTGPSGQADLIVVGGAIWTMDPARPEAPALAAAGDRVLALGGRAEVEALRGPNTRVVDLAGGLAVPGLTDAHAHLLGLGAEIDQADLRGATSIDEAVARAQRAAPPGGWVLGRGWDQNLWPGREMPTHAPLTAAFPGRAVWLRRIDGHAGWASQATLAAAGITKATPNPQGGEILRDADGEPTGVLVDAAMDLVPVPEPGDDDLRRRILAAQDRVLALGLTGVHEMGVGPRADAILRELAADGRLKLRMTGYADEAWFKAALSSGDRPPPPAAGVRYRLVGVKLYVDGALGSRGAALLAPYADRPGHAGTLMHAPGELDALVLAAVRRRWQVAAHAIGDRAIRGLLDALAAARAAAPAEDPRLRVEHAQIVDLADIPRFASLGAVASMQPTHATSDMAWVPDRLGPDRLAGAYAWRRFLDAGVPLAFGSDFPVELPDVAHGLHAAVTREDADGRPPGGWLPDQRLGLAEAVAAFTSGAAYAARQTDVCGRLAPGMLADLTCFRSDLRALAPAALRGAAVLATIVGGAVAWQA